MPTDLKQKLSSLSGPNPKYITPKYLSPEKDKNLEPHFSKEKF